ncbi:hypothetical protein H4CHR_02990 [Variovorax sp. PBS-H4]|uniref:hypothetical protein n=1 Tax=Variovorax sp. PBS-H4 TaxID=434008 RepID=UPI0013172863|nr:hypothetical protein [Variovorax sp. PBS-H4]VTU32332.1 hypothetical protein H4CHR_02990 [Variovorax sp. PBS-H4]
MVGELLISAGPQRAYDQLFPANVYDGATVMIGQRLFVWKANTARWTPGGAVDDLTITVDLATLYAANLFGVSGSIVPIPGTDAVPDLVAIFEAHLATGSNDTLATIPGTDPVPDLAAIYEDNL